jgi:hypothetical protein
MKEHSAYCKNQWCRYSANPLCADKTGAMTFEDWRAKNCVFAASSFIKCGDDMNVGDGKLDENRAECAKFLEWKLSNWKDYKGSQVSTNYDNSVKNLIVATLNLYEVNGR